MKLFSKIIKEGKELIGVDSVDDEEYNEEYDEDYEEEEIKETKKNKISKSLLGKKKKNIKEKDEEYDEENFEEESDYSTVFIDPKQFEDCKKIANFIDKGKMITINLENVGPNVAQRIMDFLAGAMEIKNASFAQIAKNVYTIVPENMKVFYEGKKREKKLIDLEKGEKIKKKN